MLLPNGEKEPIELIKTGEANLIYFLQKYSKSKKEA